MTSLGFFLKSADLLVCQIFKGQIQAKRVGAGGLAAGDSATGASAASQGTLVDQSPDPLPGKPALNPDTQTVVSPR